MSTRMKWFIVFILSLTLVGCNHPKQAGTKENGKSNAGKSEVQVPNVSTSPDANLDDGNQGQEDYKPVIKTQDDPSHADAGKTQDNQKSADTTQTNQKSTDTTQTDQKVADATQTDQKIADATQTDQKTAKKSQNDQISSKKSVGPKKTTGSARVVPKKPDVPAHTEKESNKVNLSYYENFCFEGDYDEDPYMNFNSVSDNQIHLDLALLTKDGTNGINEECLGTLHGDKVDFEFVGTGGADGVNYDDRSRDKGGGTLRFDGDDVLVKIIVEKRGSSVCHTVYPEFRLYRTESLGPTDGSYILPDSSSRYLTEKDLEGISKQDLPYARNEIYARHQHAFDNPQYASYFYKKTWYAYPEDHDILPQGHLNDYEIKNIKLIKKAENR